MRRHRYYDEEFVRAALKFKITMGHTQVEIARACGVSPQNVSAMVKGAPIVGKVLAWLGFRRVEGLYEKTAQKRGAA